MTAVQAGRSAELPGSRATPQQLLRAVHRYGLAARHSTGKDVLEVACGTGQGLGVVARKARAVVAGDLSEPDLLVARSVNPEVPLIRFDARDLPFRDGSFDLIVMLEAIYYLSDPARSLGEFARILRANGAVVIGTVNPAWRDFGPAPGSRHYFDSRGLRELVQNAGFSTGLFAAFPAPDDLGSRAASLARQASARLGLVWPTALRWAIRRALHGPVHRYPRSLEPLDDVEPVERIAVGRIDTTHQVLYAIGTKVAE